MCDLNDALDCLIDDMDAHLEREDFKTVNMFLTKVKVHDQHHSILLGILCTTLVASHLLPERSSFYDRVEEEFRLTRSEADTQDILQRLR
jgi:hypothetical protein